MYSFNTTAFTIAGTAIAVFGIGLYIWDTRKYKLSGTFTSSGTNQYTSSYSPVNTNTKSHYYRWIKTNKKKK